jgi:hypothetical protein
MSVKFDESSVSINSDCILMRIAAKFVVFLAGNGKYVVHVVSLECDTWKHIVGWRAGKVVCRIVGLR